MTTRFFVAILAVFIVVGMCGYAVEADAARFGGGRSFGGSSSFSKPFSSSRVPSSSMRNPSAAQQQPGAAAAAGAARPGFGMMGGVLGGLLAGSLLGSLFSGNGFGGGGMLDILLIGGGLFLLFKFLGRRRAAQQAQTSGTGFRMPVPNREQDDQTVRYQGQQNQPAQGPLGQLGQQASSAWDALSGRNAATATDQGTQQAAPNPDVPAGFESEDFLRGAKMAYERMNASWDKRDLDDISQFTTTPFLTEIREQATASPDAEKTELMLVNASLISVISEAGREIAAVYFDVLLRENPSQTQPTEVREVWHFVRAANSTDMWKLDGIQQVE